MKKLRILLADDHTVMRTGLRALLDQWRSLEVAWESRNGRETVELASGGLFARGQMNLRDWWKDKAERCSRCPTVGPSFAI